VAENTRFAKSMKYNIKTNIFQDGKRREDEGMKIITVLYPIWIGIAVNIVMSLINLSLIGHYGSIASAYMKHSGKILFLLWTILLSLTAYNGGVSYLF